MEYLEGDEERAQHDEELVQEKVEEQERPGDDTRTSAPRYAG
jgi:hypothetical protein